MGKLFRSWFKKKKKQEPATPSTEKNQLGENERQLTGTKIHSDDEALTFTHGSLLDDVLSGLKDHHDDTESTEDAPDSPPFSSIRAILPDHHSQQKQINNQLSENNGSSVCQQSMVTQTPPCRATPNSPSISPSTPTQVVAPPGSAATPSTTANTKLAPSPLVSYPSSYSALPVQSISQPNNTLDQQNGMIVMTNAPLESGISDNPNGHGTVIKNIHRQQKASTMTNQDQQQPEEHQEQHEQHPIQHSVVKSPSIISSKVSHDSNQEKRNRYLQVTGVSMSRMKERHRQECRRSMQSNSNQMNGPTQHQSDQFQQTQPVISPSPHPSFQSNQFGQHPQLIHYQNQQKKLNQLAQRHNLSSPSMPSLYPLESMSFYSPQTQSQQQLTSTIPAAAAAAAGASFPLLPPAGTVPPNSMVRSSSLMTNIHQSSSIPDSGVTTSSPPPGDFTHRQHHWRQQPLFPYQSDIVLPPYNPAQLNAIPLQQQLGSMMIPSTSSYRINTTSANHKQMFPRSASVYGGVNQYHQQKEHDITDRISLGGGILLRTSMVDSSLQPSITAQHQRMSMSSVPRLYKPQLSLSTLPSNDQHQEEIVKQHSGTSVFDQAVGTGAPSNDAPTVGELPTSFLPSTHSPCDEPKKDDCPPTTAAESLTSSASSSSSSGFQQQSTDASSPTIANSNTEHKEDNSSNNNDDDKEDLARSNSSCTINTCFRHPSIKIDDSNGGLDEKLEIPSLVEHLPTKLQQQAELRIMKKHRQPYRRRRRFSLPTMPTSPSASSSSSSLSSISSSKVENGAPGLDDKKKSISQLPQFAGSNINSRQESDTTTTEEVSQKSEAPTSNDHTHQQPGSDHSTHDNHHQHQGLPVSVCSISSSNGSSPSHNGPWSANSYHSCVAPLAVNTAPPCCPPSTALPTHHHNCQQQHPHHHYHHQQPPPLSQHFHGHHLTCGHQSSIPMATAPIPSSCCSTPPYVPPPVVQAPPSCCSQSHHYRHHHHHHSHHQRCQHRHSHHHSHPKQQQQQQMKKSNSLITKVDQDDAATIRSNATKSVLGQKGRQQQKKMMPPQPPSATDADDEDDDDHTISGTPSATTTSPEKKPVESQSVQRPLFRSFLPRPPRFSTSIPRPPQQQQQQKTQQKVKVSASKSSYSWIPSRS